MKARVGMRHGGRSKMTGRNDHTPGNASARSMAKSNERKAEAL